MLVDTASGCALPTARRAKIDLERELWGPAFESLKNVDEFAKLYVDPECKTLVWPSGADQAPQFLYDELKAAMAEKFAAK